MQIFLILFTISSLSSATDRRLLQFTNPPHSIVSIPTNIPNPYAFVSTQQNNGYPYVPAMPAPTQQNGNAQIPPMTNAPLPIVIPTGATQYLSEKKCDISYTNPPLPNSCAQKEYNILASERFLLLCSTFGACAGSDITLNYPINGVIQRIQGLWFTETYAAKDAIITINNKQLNQAIKIEQIQCNGPYACVDTTFIFKGLISVAEFKCSNEEYCRGCEVKNDITDYIGIPCNYY